MSAITLPNGLTVTTGKIQQPVTLPKRKIYKTPRILLGDAYTIGSDLFQSDKAKEKSTYYIAFRRPLHEIDPDLYEVGDDRIIFVGLQRILEKLFYEPVTHEEIDEAKRFLSTAKITTKGLAEYQFPEHLWRRVVDEFNGRPPIQVKAMPEGSVVYPNEPVVQVTSLVPGFGELAAWFEPKLLQLWASSERVTQDQHFLKQICRMVKEVDPKMDDDKAHVIASLMVTDFSDRSCRNIEESEEMQMLHLYSWLGTDEFTGAYQAWKNANEMPGIGTSVNALAHRIVQAYDLEEDSYRTIYERSAQHEIIGMVGDTVDFFNAGENYILPLALRSKTEDNGKIVVAAPDSGDILKQVIWVCEIALKHGLYEEVEIDGKKWNFGTFLKFLAGDSLDFRTMKEILRALLERNFAFYSWGIFGVGGGLVNNLRRDDLSAKYALCAIGNENKGVCKFTHAIRKMSLPGPFKVLRDFESLQKKQTIAFESETGKDVRVEYFNGTRLEKPFGVGQDDDFLTNKARIQKQMKTMPLSLVSPENHNYPITEAVLNMRRELLQKYAPIKKTDNY